MPPTAKHVHQKTEYRRLCARVAAAENDLASRLQQMKARIPTMHEANVLRALQRRLTRLKTHHRQPESDGAGS
jgi:ribosomal protein S4